VRTGIEQQHVEFGFFAGGRQPGRDVVDADHGIEPDVRRMLQQVPAHALEFVSADRPALARAFFDGPGQFSLRLNADCGGPVFVRLGFTGSGWRVQALYY